MKKVIIVMFSLVLMFVGCESNNQNEDSIFSENESIIQDDNIVLVNTDKINIALVMKTLTNPFFIEMEKGAREAAATAGVSLRVETGAQETSIEQQITIIEDLIIDKVDAIVIAPGDSKEIIPALKKAQDAGIVIVNIDNKLDTEVSKVLGLIDIPFISIDNKKAAYNTVKYLSDQIILPTEVLVIEGIVGANNSEMRKNGAIEAFSENPNIKIVSVVSANWKIDEAQTVTENEFLKNPDIGAVFAANDMMAIGVIQYLENSTYDNVLVGGFDAIPEATQMVDEGLLEVTVDQQPYLQGYKGIEYALEMLNGEKVPMETLLDSILINKK